VIAPEWENEPDDPDGWMPYCDDEMNAYDGEIDPDDWRSHCDDAYGDEED
jgi:hypothetical protein